MRQALSDGEKEIQRTMIELLTQMDGFEARGEVKVIMATNRIESLVRLRMIHASF